MRYVEDRDVFMRQLGIADPGKLQVPITIVGAGSIGSHAAVSCAKMGCGEITVYDPDVVDPHNHPNQLFLRGLSERSKPEETFGVKKVTLLAETILALASVEITSIPVKLPKVHNGDRIMLEGIVISGVDSMQARQDIWQVVKGQPGVKYYIDGRMGAQVGELHHLDPNDANAIEVYERTLVDDGEIEELPCTERTICYTQFVLAGLIGSLVRQVCVETTVSIPSPLTLDLQNGLVVPSGLIGKVMMEMLTPS